MQTLLLFKDRPLLAVYGGGLVFKCVAVYNHARSNRLYIIDNISIIRIVCGLLLLLPVVRRLDALNQSRVMISLHGWSSDVWVSSDEWQYDDVHRRTWRVLMLLSGCLVS